MPSVFRMTRITLPEKRLPAVDTAPRQGCKVVDAIVPALDAYAHWKPMQGYVKGYNESSCAAIITSLAYTRGKHAWIAL